jgi:drug/metabolite transporter (DMT)-like permease
MSFLPIAGAARGREAEGVNQQVIARPESRPQSSQGAGAWAALLVVWVVWGSTYVAIRVGDRSIPPLAMAAVRYLAAGALLYPVARLRAGRLHGDRLHGDRPHGGLLHSGRARPSGAQWAGMAVVGTLLLAFGNGGLSYAEQTLPAGLAALLVASVPLWMALADLVINGRRLRPAGWTALIAGLAGIAVLAQPHGHGSLLPVLIVLGASLSWGVGSVLAGRLPAPPSPLLGSAMEMLTGGLVLVALAAATGEFKPVHASGSSLLALLYLIVPGSLLALTCYVIALRRLPVSVVSTYAYVNPVVAVGLGALLLGERPTWSALLGGAIVVASVALLLTNRKGEGR